MIVTAALNRSNPPASGGIEAAHRFTLDNLWTRRDPILAVAYLDRDIILYRTPKFNRAFDAMVQAKRVTNSAPAPRKPSAARIPEARISEARSPLPKRRTPMIAALTP